MGIRHCGTKELQTPRLLLRRFTENDAQAMYENWASDPEVTRFLRFSPHESVEASRKTLAGWATKYSDLTHYIWAIVRLSDGVVIGSLGVSPGEHDETVLEPGYALCRACWGEGYMTEALGAVMQFMFDEVGVPLLDCSHAMENPASGRVMQKNGFVYTRDDVYHKFDGTAVACRCYTLTKEQYETKRQANK